MSFEGSLDILPIGQMDWYSVDILEYHWIAGNIKDFWFFLNFREISQKNPKTLKIIKNLEILIVVSPTAIKRSTK